MRQCEPVLLKGESTWLQGEPELLQGEAAGNCSVKLLGFTQLHYCKKEAITKHSYLNCTASTAGALYFSVFFRTKQEHNSG
jgi:hypothetical protein